MNPEHSVTSPPAWAEALLLLSLRRSDREAISGDLLEVYRDAIVPSRGQRRADAWYVRQMATYLLRATWVWALVFSSQFVARTAYDWLVPTHDFHRRAEFSTYFGVATFFLTGLWAAWRSGSLLAGTVLTMVTSQMAALFSVAGATLLIIVLRDPQTQNAIANSPGGLDEVYLLPFMMIIPAIVLGTVAGAVGSLGRRILRRV
jgi:hypothetical protein